MAQVGPFQGIILKQAATYKRVFWFGTTGQTVAVNISKNGGPFAASANSPATEIANGWYFINLTGVDTATAGDLAYHCTAASGGPLDFVDTVQTQVFTDMLLDVSGNVSINSSIKKNAACNGFTFVMTSTVNGNELPGLGSSIVAQRSLNGAGYAPCANPVFEIGNGAYGINLAASDLNAAVVMLRFTNVSANTNDILLLPQP